MGNSNDFFFHLSFICLMDFDFSVIILHFFFTKGLFLKKLYSGGDPHCGILLNYRKIKQNCTKHGDDAIPR